MSQRESDKQDVVIVGGGAAGLSTALVLARARRRVVVVDAGEPRNEPAAHLHGFLSRDGMKPSELLSTGREEVEGYGGRVLKTQVTGLERQASGEFLVHLSEDAILSARAIVVATGLKDMIPDVPGLRGQWGHTVLHCPYCHGYEVRDTPLGVLGGYARELSLHQVQLLRQWSADITFIPNGIVLNEDERARMRALRVDVVDGEPVNVHGGSEQLRVELADGRNIDLRAMFIAPQPAPQDDLLRDLGCVEAENGWIVADAAGRTSVRGVWAVGNVVDPRAQLITAAGAGSVLAIALNSELIEEEVAQAMRHSVSTP
ncbi:MAG: NAD(P)/FAD-dependent oxidoreductase [Corynebacteriales bacterium]|nr:NAD(P)/FAD-dependent oxidoreductase [Mycobacteriales bacterium]